MSAIAGGNTGGESWRFYLDGTPYTGDPGTISLASHQEIAAVYGSLSSGVAPPDHYDFPTGL